MHKNFIYSECANNVYQASPQGGRGLGKRVLVPNFQSSCSVLRMEGEGKYMHKIDPNIPYAVKTDWNHHVQAAYSSRSMYWQS